MQRILRAISFRHRTQLQAVGRYPAHWIVSPFIEGCLAAIWSLRSSSICRLGQRIPTKVELEAIGHGEYGIPSEMV